MNVLETLTVFANKQEVEDYLVYVLMRNEVVEKQFLYSCVLFDINVVPLTNFRHLCRFEKADIIVLHAALKMPRRWETADRHIIGGLKHTTGFSR